MKTRDIIVFSLDLERSDRHSHQIIGATHGEELNRVDLTLLYAAG